MWYARVQDDKVSTVQLVATRSLHFKAMLAGPFHQRGMRAIYRLCVRPNRQNTEREEQDDFPTHDSTPEAK
jgi:hypothetical protein